LVELLFDFGFCHLTPECHEKCCHFFCGRDIDSIWIVPRGRLQRNWTRAFLRYASASRKSWAKSTPNCTSLQRSLLVC
jgi:hypothetical protein